MNCSHRTFFPVSGAVLAAVCFIAFNLSGAPSQAAVPQPQAEKFVNALVDVDSGSGYPDIAIYYMEKIYQDGTIPAEYKSIYDMEMGRLHMLNSGIQSSQDDQLKEIDAAHESFAKFIKENPNHPRVRECASQYAGLMMARGTIYRDLAVKSTNKKQEQRDEWMKISRDSFTAAQNEFLANQKRARDVVKKYKDEKKETGEEYDEAVTDFLQAWLAVAGAYYEIAQTYPVDSKEYKDFLEKSRKEYNTIFTKYGAIEPPFIAGLYARVREGRIMMDQGVFEDPNKMDKGALSIFDETLTLDNNAANRTMRDEALLYYLQSAVKYKNDKEPEKKGKILDQALTRFSEWYEKDYTSARQGQLLTQQLLLAGCDVAADKISNLPDEQKKARQNALLAKNTLEILDILAKTSFKDEAKAVKAKLGVVGPVENVPPEKMTYAELIKELNQVRETISDIQTESASAQTEEQKAAIQKKMLEAGEKFLKLYELAEFRRPVDISGSQLRQLNSNRYLAVYMMFLKQDNYRAVMLADFVVRNYSTDPISETMADLEMKILRSHFANIVQSMRKDGKSDAAIQEATKFELLKMSKLASIIQTRTASKGPEMSDNAWSIVCDSFIDIGDTKHGEAAMNKISEDSDKRADCEIRTGNLLWNSYLRGMNADLSVRPSKEKLAEYKATSQKILQDGIDRMKKSMGADNEPTSNLIFAAFTLANQKLKSGDPAGALELLNDPQFGPLTLVKKDSPLVLKNELDIRSLRVALNALVAAQQLDDAKDIMELLEKRVEQSESVAENGKSKEEQLTNIYLTLGLELKENLEVFNREGQKEKAENLEKGFEVFLQRIADLPDIKFGQMYWVAQTYQSLGENEVSENKSVTDKAKALFGKAVDTYNGILKKVAEKEGFVQKPELTARIIDERLARCLATSQQYEEAIKKMGEILSKTPNNIDLQAEAVRCYQKWGESTADPEKSALYLKKALVGCGKDFSTTGQKDPKQDGKPAIWGWNTLANKMQTQLTKKNSQDPRVTDTYYEARLTISDIYLKQAEGIKDTAKQMERLQDAEKILLSTHRAFPTLNNEETFQKYDTQLKLVRTKMKALDPNIAVKGFSELETASGFAAKGDYQEAITRVMKELSNGRTRKETLERMQPTLAGYYSKWGEKSEKNDPKKAMELYEFSLNGDPNQLNEAGKQIFIGWNGYLKAITNDKGEPIRNADPDQDKFLDYLQARLAIAEIKYNIALLEIAAVQPKEEQPADEQPQENNAEEENAAEEAPASEDVPEEAAEEVSETTAGETDAEAAETDAAEAEDAASEEETPAEEDTAESTQTTEEPASEPAPVADNAAASSDANSNIPPKALQLFNEIETILREDYDKYKSIEADAEILGNSDILQSYENLLRKVQEQLGKPVSGFAPPESLLPQKVEEEEAPEKPTDPRIIYGILGGIGVLGLIIIIIAFLPKKKKLVEKQNVNVTDGGIAVGSEKVEEKVDLGFAQQEGKAQDKIDLGFGGFNANDSPAPNGKIDLGFGPVQQDATFSFDFNKKPAQPAPAGRPAPRPAGQQPAGKPAPRPAGQQPAGKPAPRPAGQQPAGKPAPRPAGQQPQEKPQKPTDKQ
ncbi:MAG: hypothetical protein IKX40_00120 [Thermoguttaceae bacterium]|nr:hypothetical protein [Thermoguttaceae bacterium]